MKQPRSAGSSSDRQLAEALLGSGLCTQADVLGEAPERVGRYDVLGLLGKGAQAEVYLGRDPVMGRDVAIKRISVSVSAERFQREMLVLGQLRHPNVVQIYDAGVDEDDAPYYVMELLPGKTLEQVELSQEEAVEVVAQVARGCQAAHELGIVHRDLKPENVVLADRPVVVDFGVAKVLSEELSSTQSGYVVGTPLYMAPEQIAGGAVDARSDVYALGVVLYEALCGEVPYDAVETGLALAVQIAQGQIVPLRERAPGVPAALSRVVARALSLEPEARYPSAGEFAEALEALALAGEEGPAQARSAVAWVVGALALLAVFTGGGLVLASRLTPGSTSVAADPSGVEPAAGPAVPGQPAEALTLEAAASQCARGAGEAPTLSALAELGSTPRERDVVAVLHAVRRYDAGAASALDQAYPPLLRLLSGNLEASAADALSSYVQRVVTRALRETSTSAAPEVAEACLRHLAGLEPAASARQRVTCADLRVLVGVFGQSRQRASAGSIQQALDLLLPARVDADLLAGIQCVHVALLRAGIRKRSGKRVDHLLAAVRSDLQALRERGWDPARAEALQGVLEEFER